MKVQSITEAVEAMSKMQSDSMKTVGMSTGSGAAWHMAARVINGHMVQVNTFEGTQVEVWLNKSSEPLTIADAAEIVMVAR